MTPISRYVSAALVVLSCTLCISTYHYFGHTWDEPEHLAAGMQLLDRGIYTYDIQHPPLARVAMAVGPYLAGARAFGEPGPSGEQEGRDLLYRTGNYDRILTLARLGVLPFLIVMLGATWAWTRHLFGEVPAAAAVFLLATTPTILGHAAVAALDVPGAALAALALYLLVRWFETPSRTISLLLGITGGLAVGSKLSAIPFLLLCTLAIGLVRPAIGGVKETSAENLSRRRALRGAGAAVAAVLTLIVVYGGRFEYLTDTAQHRSEALDYIAPPGTGGHDLAYRIARQLPVPVAFEKLTLGIKALNKHNREGHVSFLLGDVKKTGWWYFYPVALAVKTPLPLLLLGIAGLALLVGRGFRNRDWRLLAPAVCFAVILAFCCSYSRINIGVRHVVILYPLLALAAAHATVTAWRQDRRSARLAIVALLVWQAATLGSSYPDYLAYFNELAPRPEAVLIDSDLDWGQDMRRLERALHERQVPSFSFVFRGTEDWIREDFPPFSFLPPNLRTTGWVAVDVLAKLMLTQGGDGFAWLDAYQPVARIGKTIDLYFIPPE